jgi:hypothetical protein
MGEELLMDTRVAADVTDGTNRVGRLALLDVALVYAFVPEGIIAEVRMTAQPLSADCSKTVLQ